MRVVGADACVGGWVAVALVAGRVARAWMGASLAALLVEEPAATVVGVDLPLGGVPEDWRSADREAKRRLGAQHAKVFAVPPRSVWDEPTYAAANTRCRAITGAGLSVQAYRLVPKMLEAERYRDTGPHALHEIHPELVFASLAGGLLPHGKKTWNGQAARRALLAGMGVVLADDLPEAAGVPANDVLDAAAVAWGAHRIARGVARWVPDPPDQHDHRGRPIVISVLTPVGSPCAQQWWPMEAVSPWFTSRNDGENGRAAMVAFAAARLLDGRRSEQAFTDLVGLGTDRRLAAIAVCVAIGTPWDAAEARMAGFDTMWASLEASKPEVAGGLLELYGYFDAEVVLDPEQNLTASNLRQAMSTVEFLPSGYANQMYRLLRTGALREAFLSLVEMGGLRWQDNVPFWFGLREAARRLDPLDDEVTAALRRCEQYARG